MKNLSIKGISFLVLSAFCLYSCEKENTKTHKIIFNSNGGSEVETQDIVHGEKVTRIEDPTRNGYTFVNWTYDNEPWSFTNDVVYCDMTLDANWNVIIYSISYDLDGGSIDSNNPTSYTIEDHIVLNEPVKDGYTFLGWFNGDVEVSSEFNGMFGDLVLTAHWSISTYKVTVISSDSSKGTVNGNGDFEYKSSVTVTANPLGDNIFNGWFRDSKFIEKVSSKNSYSFIIGKENVELYAKFMSKEEHAKEQWDIKHGVIATILNDGETVTYGMYPQTNVNDASLINILDSLTDSNECGYFFYDNEYYYKSKATPYKSNYTFDSGETIVSDNTYWFKVEPIEWKILENNDGECFLTNKNLLVNHRYNEDYVGAKSKSDYQGDIDTVYSNNYKYSEIRSWLNTDFYTQAFYFDNDNVSVSSVDNSMSSTLDSEDSFVCEDTNDKLFLLSAKELTTCDYGFNASLNDKDLQRRCKTTDFSRASGTSYKYSYSESKDYYQNGTYYTRSPIYDCDCAQSVIFDGSFGSYGYDYVGLSRAGVRLGLRVTINLDISMEESDTQH